MKKKILIIDDEIHIIELMSMNLKSQGYTTVFALSGEEGIEIALKEIPDLILLDLMLEGIDGIETCRRLKLNRVLENIPVIMVTAKSEESDKVIGLTMGADDYITKPFGLRELYARISAVLRRVEKQAGGETVLRFHDLLIDSLQYNVSLHGEPVNLTLSEFRILKMMVLHQGNIVAREKIISDVLGKDSSSDDRILDVHIRNLRKKLENVTENSIFIDTVRGVGYKISEKS
jgi:two-component system alkaline phosphatase synthesis response regulator PhoP